jgi:hypothetical protein
MKVAGVPLLRFGPRSGYWYRAIQLRHYQSLLAYQHTASFPTRFNAADPRFRFPILYFTENQQAALWETRALVGSPYPGRLMVPSPASSWVVIAVRVRLQFVADFSYASQRKLIRTTVQELTGDWEGYRLRRAASPPLHPYTDVPTQRLGAALVAQSGVEAFVAYSAVDSRCKNLVVFPDKLQTGSWLKFLNPITGRVDRIGP